MVRRTHPTLVSHLHPSPQLSNFQGAFQNFGFILKDFRWIRRGRNAQGNTSHENSQFKGRKSGLTASAPSKKMFIGPKRSEYAGFRLRKTDFFPSMGSLGTIYSEQGRCWRNVNMIHDFPVCPEDFVTHGISFGEPKLGPFPC